MVDSSDDPVLDAWLRDADHDFAEAIAAEVDIEAVLDWIRDTARSTEPVGSDARPVRVGSPAGTGPDRLAGGPGHEPAFDVRHKLFRELAAELKVLRKGRGLYVGQISERVGPVLRKLCGVVDGDGPAEIRRKVADRLENLAVGLPEDLRIAVLAAFGMEREARLPFYQERVRWAAQRINRDDRTARRRIDEGLDRIAEQAVNLARVSDAADAWVSATGWHTEELKISLVLDQPVPEVFETRRVVAERDGLTDLDLAMTLTAKPDRADPVNPQELSVDVFYGGTLIKKTLESKDRFGLVLALPYELNREDRHEFAMRYRIPTGHMQPHFVCVPKHRCDLFELRIRFDLDNLPQRIWRLSEAFQRDVDDPISAGDSLIPDVAGDVHDIHYKLTTGRAYGIRWTP